MSCVIIGRRVTVGPALRDRVVVMPSFERLTHVLSLVAERLTPAGVWPAADRARRLVQSLHASRRDLAVFHEPQVMTWANVGHLAVRYSRRAWWRRATTRSTALDGPSDRVAPGEEAPAGAIGADQTGDRAPNGWRSRRRARLRADDQYLLLRVGALALGDGDRRNVPPVCTRMAYLDVLSESNSPISCSSAVARW
jgi:hypothetical protein